MDRRLAETNLAMAWFGSRLQNQVEHLRRL
jgi:hypothetical protein